MAKRKSYKSTWHDSVTEQHKIWHVTTSHKAWVQCFCNIWMLRWKYVYKFGSYFDRGCYAEVQHSHGYIEHYDCDDGSYIWDLDFSNITGNPSDLVPILGELCAAGGWSPSCYGYMLVYYDSVEEWHQVDSSIYYVRSYDDIYDQTIYEQIYCHGSELVFTGC